MPGGACWNTPWGIISELPYQSNIASCLILQNKIKHFDSEALSSFKSVLQPVPGSLHITSGSVPPLPSEQWSSSNSFDSPECYSYSFLPGDKTVWGCRLGWGTNQAWHNPESIRSRLWGIGRRNYVNGELPCSGILFWLMPPLSYDPTFRGVIGGWIGPASWPCLQWQRATIESSSPPQARLNFLIMTSPLYTAPLLVTLLDHLLPAILLKLPTM